MWNEKSSLLGRLLVSVYEALRCLRSLAQTLTGQGRKKAAGNVVTAAC